jgi:hypothetical protein
MACRIAVAGVLFFNAFSALALDAVERTPLVQGPDLQLPGFGRVALVFLMMGAIALVTIAVLKRMKPWLLKRGLGAAVTSQIVVVSHRRLSRTLNIYLVDVEQQRFMIVQSSNTTTVSRMDSSAGGDTIAEHAG